MEEQKETKYSSAWKSIHSQVLEETISNVYLEYVYGKITREDAEEKLKHFKESYPEQFKR